ncbi:MAG: 4Fe-4S binding protein [Tannerella sp.]|jgi:NAD-dependent dihydropyrimidine dehydrogenase PreA subunit|nr:4Fe-4S binding protein [Tannerella sp.]
MFWNKSKLIADVIADRCCNCGACVRFCRHRALEIAEVQGKTYTFVNDPNKCAGCGKCVLICPGRAIKMVERYY